MKAMSLQSGSNGNAIYVEADGVKLLFDAGISGRQAQLRLAAAGVDIRRVDLLLISHDHRDHVACAGIYQRKFGLTLAASEATLAAAHRRHKLGRLGEVVHFAVGQTLQVGSVTIETLATTHDAADGCGFVVCAGNRRLGILTDLGCVFDGLGDMIASLDAVFLESNYDPHMLESGPYPWPLKRRISGPAGHISNIESAELVARYGRRLAWTTLAHLSEDNNTPQLALATHRQMVAGASTVHLAGRYEPTAMLEW